MVLTFEKRRLTRSVLRTSRGAELKQWIMSGVKPCFLSCFAF